MLDTKSKVVQRAERPYKKKSSVRPLEDLELEKSLFENLAMSDRKRRLKRLIPPKLKMLAHLILRKQIMRKRIKVIILATM